MEENKEKTKKQDILLYSIETYCDIKGFESGERFAYERLYSNLANKSIEDWDKFLNK